MFLLIEVTEAQRIELTAVNAGPGEEHGLPHAVAISVCLRL